MARQHPDVPFVIDFHAHMLDAEIVKICGEHSAITGFGRRPPPSKPHFRKFYEPELQIADMDERGIDVHVLFTGPVFMSTSWADAGTALRLTQQMNDKMADWVRRYPDRFVGTVTLPMQDIDAAVTELRRAVGTLGHRALLLPTQFDGDYLGDQRYRPLWEAVRELDIPVFIHPEGLSDPWFHQYALWNSLGQSIEEAKVMASIIYEGLLDAVPGLKIVVAHGGGYFPGYMGRLDRNIEKPETLKNIKGKPSDYLRHFYYDTCVYDPLALQTLLKRVGADRLVLGADYPVGDADPVGVIKDAVTLTGTDLNMIAAGTPARLLDIKIPAPATA